MDWCIALCQRLSAPASKRNVSIGLREVPRGRCRAVCISWFSRIEHLGNPGLRIESDPRLN
jgi:hypothetical protein